MGQGSRYQTQTDLYAAKAITIPVNGAAATLLSLIGLLDVIDSNGAVLGDIAKLLQRVTAIRITGQAGAYLYGRTAATALIPVAATGDLEEPVTGLAMLNSFFQSTIAGTVAAVVVVYFD